MKEMSEHGRIWGTVSAHAQDKYKRKVHQGLTKETGYQHLIQQISTSTTMMRGFDTWDEFEPVFRKAFNISDSEKV